MKKEIVTMLLAAALMTSSLTACSNVQADGNDIDNTTVESIINLPTTPNDENEKKVENSPVFSGIYADVLEQFRKFLLIKKNYEDYTTIFVDQYPDRNEIINTLTQASIDIVPEEAGYCIKDINGDGSDELILLDENYHIYALFTIVNSQIKVVDTFWGETNHTGAIGSDGTIYKHGYGKGDNYYGYARKISGKGELIGLIFKCVDNSVHTTEADDLTPFELEYFKEINGERTVLRKESFIALYEEYSFIFSNPTETTKQSGIECISMQIN